MLIRNNLQIFHKNIVSFVYKKIFITLSLLLTTIIQVKAYPTKIKAAYAIGIFHNNGNGENIQHKIETKDNYNGTCYSKIVVFSNAGNFISNVKIGNSIGTLIKSTPIYNKLKVNTRFFKIKLLLYKCRYKLFFKQISKKNTNIALK